MVGDRNKNNNRIWGQFYFLSETFVNFSWLKFYQLCNKISWFCMVSEKKKTEIIFFLVEPNSTHWRNCWPKNILSVAFVAANNQIQLFYHFRLGHSVFGKGRDIETMAHSDFKCRIRKCLMETMSLYIWKLGDISMYNECPSVSAVSSKNLQMRRSLSAWKSFPITVHLLNIWWLWQILDR